MQGSLICDNVILDEKCEIKDCIIGSGKRVEPQGRLFHGKYLFYIKRKIRLKWGAVVYETYI